ncbi:3-oxoacyl-reductase [Lophiotrema nucula]|uniref:3-oxoacyl-reductase n=1 Tax=Lophiotrema nucula TaxID=690887 RepID=A0A6A5Z567_9PLEO|nr:3-oxoacyl-reductase [Lophiotrema nucula]
MTFSKQFSGRVIAITGAASGIGLATAHLLASRGAKGLSLADLSREGLETASSSLKEEYPETGVFLFPLDVRKSEEVEQWIQKTVEHFGHLDGAANMAGVIPRTFNTTGLDAQDLSDWDFIIGVNLTGVMHCLRAQLKHISAPGGSIVNAGSIAGLIGRPKLASYAASKHGVLGLTKSAAKEVGEKGVRVNAICPGRINTPMASNAGKVAATTAGGGAEARDQETIQGVALRREGQPEEVAKLIAFLLSDESAYITGASISIDGGWNC